MRLPEAPGMMVTTVMTCQWLMKLVLMTPVPNPDYTC
jgi:hypothetical protein